MMHQNMKSLYTRKLYQIVVYQSYFNLNTNLKKQRKKKHPSKPKNKQKLLYTEKSSDCRLEGIEKFDNN